MSFESEASFHSANSLSDALGALHERGSQGQAIAGGTWVMRSSLRSESQNRAYVSLSRLDELRHVLVSDTEIDIGACVTHTQLALALKSESRCRGLAVAAGGSANPAVRNVATVGGNLCASDFAAADLVPALMALGALVDLEDSGGSDRIPMELFMAVRGALEPGRLVRGVILPLEPIPTFASAHVRLPLRKGGDYPVAIVSMAVSLKRDRTVENARVVVGSVESSARRWLRLEADLIGRPLETKAAVRQAEATAGDFIGRDGVEAPGWYRIKVLPTLVGRAVDQLLLQ
jgi:aerobic carbon-monoxide dehydrogenase medium subunit